MTVTSLAVGTAEVAPAPGAVHVPVPCAARPGSTLWHLDGACRCFVGGPPPEFAPSAVPAAR